MMKRNSIHRFFFWYLVIGSVLFTTLYYVTRWPHGGHVESEISNIIRISFRDVIKDYVSVNEAHLGDTINMTDMKIVTKTGHEIPMMVTSIPHFIPVGDSIMKEANSRKIIFKSSEQEFEITLRDIQQEKNDGNINNAVRLFGVYAILGLVILVLSIRRK